MNRRYARPRIPATASPRHLSPLPHPSWLQANADEAARRNGISADDFWSRLGL